MLSKASSFSDSISGVSLECPFSKTPELDNNQEFPTPPMSKIRDLQHAAEIIESDEDSEHEKDWLNILRAPGSSLGGARPKANVLDENGDLWI